jgi:HSP20 family protein
MNLIKRWTRGHGNGGEMVKVRRHGEDNTRLSHGLSRFRDEMDRMFDRVWREFEHGGPLAVFGPTKDLNRLTDWPAVDMAEDDKAVAIRVDVPGLEAKDVDVEVSGNLLTIRGSRNEEWDETQHGVHRRERRSGSFTRTLTLPGYVDADKLEARYDKGVLNISVPKAEGKQPHRVEVKP